MSQFVGRERELTTLRGLLDEALSGHGRLVLASGEAGIGKTSLVREFKQFADERDVLTLCGFCYDLSSTPPMVCGSN
jgi:predicted ATPase